MFGSIGNVIKFIINHPLGKQDMAVAFMRFVYWQARSRIVGRSFIASWVGKSKLLLKKGMAGATGNYYVGLHDFEEMCFLLHSLRPTDIFYDLGANVGCYTILASKVMGARTIAVEPVPTTYANLLNNLDLNGVRSQVVALNAGLNETSATLYFSSDLDTINHVVDKNFKNAIKVQVYTLDDLVSKYGCPVLIKLDVEGYEHFVLKGGKNVLENPALTSIIIELNGSGNRYGIADSAIDRVLRSFNFLPYQYRPYQRDISALETFNHNANTIYLRNPGFLMERLKGASGINVYGHCI